MGVEPTAARSARPATGFEDRGIHRDTTTPFDCHQYSQSPSPEQQIYHESEFIGILDLDCGVILLKTGLLIDDFFSPRQGSF